MSLTFDQFMIEMKFKKGNVGNCYDSAFSIKARRPGEGHGSKIARAWSAHLKEKIPWMVAYLTDFGSPFPSTGSSRNATMSLDLITGGLPLSAAFFP